jgi:hypothetical protein
VVIYCAIETLRGEYRDNSSVLYHDNLMAFTRFFGTSTVHQQAVGQLEGSDVYWSTLDGVSLLAHWMVLLAHS